MLWFDVGYIRDTTEIQLFKYLYQLWFDVGYIRDTTYLFEYMIDDSCGLMQDI